MCVSWCRVRCAGCRVQGAGWAVGYAECGVQTCKKTMNDKDNGWTKDMENIR